MNIILDERVEPITSEPIIDPKPKGISPLAIIGGLLLIIAIVMLFKYLNDNKNAD